MFRTAPLLSLAFVLSVSAWGADESESIKKQERRDYYAAAAGLDFSTMWRHDGQHQDFIDDAGAIAQRVLDLPANQTIGFCGADFQRFYIRYLRVVKDAKDPYLYRVTGKTRLGKAISDFSGTLRIRQAMIFKYSPYIYFPNTDSALPLPDEKPFEYGLVLADLQFQQTPTQVSGGALKGTLRSYFHLVGQKVYVATTGEAGDYLDAVNDVVTTWSDVRSKRTEVCNWTQRDSIPGGEGLMWRGDDRVSYVRKEHYSKGWENFGVVGEGYSDEQEQQARERAKQAELIKWWQP
jgi:hypothetical protein